MARYYSVHDLISELSTAPRDTQGWQTSCREALASLASGRAVLNYLTSLDSQQMQMRFDGSHETSTHFKWLIYRSYTPRFTLWLHEYKISTSRRTGYAEVPHDHRYDISSLILVGGYRATEWEPSSKGVTQKGAMKRFSPGDVMQLAADQIHSLVDIDERTLTVVVEGPRLKSTSEAYYPGEPSPRSFPDFPAQWSRISRYLRE